MDFRTERGYIGRVYEGGTMALESPMFIREGRAQEWVDDEIDKALALGKRLVGRVKPAFMDPNKLTDSIARMQDAIRG